MLQYEIRVSLNYLLHPFWWESLNVILVLHVLVGIFYFSLITYGFSCMGSSRFLKMDISYSLSIKKKKHRVPHINIPKQEYSLVQRKLFRNVFRHLKILSFKGKKGGFLIMFQFAIVDYSSKAIYLSLF